MKLGLLICNQIQSILVLKSNIHSKKSLFILKLIMPHALQSIKTKDFLNYRNGSLNIKLLMMQSIFVHPSRKKLLNSIFKMFNLLRLFFVLLRVFVPLENFSLIWRRHHCWWRAANFDLCSALMAIEHWGFFNVQHLLWHGASVYNGHLRGPWH